MKNHSEVFSICQNFCSEVKNQFNTFIKILRTDNTKKNLVHVSQTLCLNNIVHQSSCSFIPQQNGVDKRKN